MGKCSQRKEVTFELSLEGRIVVSTQKKRSSVSKRREQHTFD